MIVASDGSLPFSEIDCHQPASCTTWFGVAGSLEPIVSEPLYVLPVSATKRTVTSS